MCFIVLAEDMGSFFPELCVYMFIPNLALSVLSVPFFLLHTITSLIVSHYCSNIRAVNQKLKLPVLIS